MWHLYRCLYDVPISLYCHRTWAPILKQIRSVIQNGQIPAENWNSEHECQREPRLCFVSAISRRPAGLSGTVLLKMNPPLLCSQPQRVCGASAVVLAVTWHGTDWRQREAASVITVFKDIFKKSPSLLDPPGALALFCFLFFFPLEFFLMLPSVALWKRAPWKPPPTTSRTAEPCSPARRGSFTPPARQWLKGCIFNSAELKERSQLCFSLSLSFFFSCLFVSISVLPPPHPPLILPLRAVWFAFQICVSYFMVFWVAQDQLFLKFFTFESGELCCNVILWLVQPFPSDSATQSCLFLSQ